MTVKTTYLGPEQETATGPDFEEQYLVTATVAPGQTISNFNLTDLLPSGEQFVALDSSTAANGSSAATTTATPSPTTRGGTLTRHFDKVVGTGGASDASMLFTFYAPPRRRLGHPLLKLSTGAFVAETDQAQATGTWIPLNPAQGTTSVTSNLAADTVTAKSEAVQEGVADLTHPGGPHARRRPPVHRQLPALRLLRHPGCPRLGGHLRRPALRHHVHPHAPVHRARRLVGHGRLRRRQLHRRRPELRSDGTTPVAFRVAAELLARGFGDGNLLGGSIPDGGTGGAEPSATPTLGASTGTIVFRTIARERFDGNYPSGEPYVDEGDLLTTILRQAGGVQAYGNLASDGSTISDSSGTAIAVRRGALSESIYAINGVGSTPKVAAGDAVTYRIEYALPTSNIEQLALSGFLPLPVFDATTVTTFDDVTGATAPASGHSQFGPSDTHRALSGIVPTLTSSASGNSLNFAYGTYHDPNQDSSLIDILYTVTVGSQPFADGLFLINQAHETEGSTNQGSATANALVQIDLTEPALAITKGVVAVDNPRATVTSNPYGFKSPGTTSFRVGATIDSNERAAAPITGTVANIDAGDRVTFAVVVQNTGSGLHGAYDVTLRDILPAGFVVPASGLDLSVTGGAGDGLNDSNVGGGSGLFDQGIVVQNPDATAATLAAYDATSGRNILVITSDLQAADTINPNRTITNTASLTSYSATEGGPDFLSSPATATATATTAPVGLSKAITATSQSFTTGTNLAIGEVATYAVTPSGTDDLGAAVTRTTTTDAAGDYAFAGLRPGRYALADLRPATDPGGAATVGTAGGLAGADVVLAIDPESGAVGTSYNFGLVGATVGGRVEVVLGDGASLGPGVGGATLTLEAPDGTVLATTTTADDGTYQFTNLPTGTYTLALTTPAGYASTTAATRTVAVPVVVTGIALGAGDSASAHNFAAEGSDLSGIVFDDLAGTGNYQAGDPVDPGAAVQLLDARGRTVAATVTGADGRYSFPGMAAGS